MQLKKKTSQGAHLHAVALVHVRYLGGVFGLIYLNIVNGHLIVVTPSKPKGQTRAFHSSHWPFQNKIPWEAASATNTPPSDFDVAKGSEQQVLKKTIPFLGRLIVRLLLLGGARKYVAEHGFLSGFATPTSSLHLTSLDPRLSSTCLSSIFMVYWPKLT